MGEGSEELDETLCWWEVAMMVEEVCKRMCTDWRSGLKFTLGKLVEHCMAFLTLAQACRTGLIELG